MGFVFHKNKSYFLVLFFLFFFIIFYLIIGRKGIEPLIAQAIEFTAQPVIPANGTFPVFFILIKE
jgi:hypothetical protein